MSNKKTLKKEYPKLAAQYPELAAEWHPTKNGDLLPTQVASNSSRRVWWLLPYDDPITGLHFDFEWEATVRSRSVENQGCPFLTGRAVWTGFNDLQTRYPELAEKR